MKLKPKPTLIVALFLIISGLSYTTFLLQSANSRLEGQLETALGYRQQLQEQSELNIRHRLDFESQLESLKEDLLTSSSQLISLSNELAEAKLQTNPDYEALLAQARREVITANGRLVERGRSSGGFSVFSDPASTRKMAEDRVAGQYLTYFETLALTPTEMDSMYKAFVDFSDERYQMLGQLIAGNLTADQAALIFGPNALVDNLKDNLTSEQAAELGAYDLMMNQDAFRQVYTGIFGQVGDAISGQIQDYVMDVVIDELFSEENNYGALVADNGSMTSAYIDKLDSFDRARERLEPNLTVEQLSQFDRFAESHFGTVDVVLEANTDGEGKVQVRNMRLSSESLPN